MRGGLAVSAAVAAGQKRLAARRIAHTNTLMVFLVQLSSGQSKTAAAFQSSFSVTFLNVVP